MKELQQNIEVWERRFGIKFNSPIEKTMEILQKKGLDPVSRKTALLVVLRNYFYKGGYDSIRAEQMAGIGSEVLYQYCYRGKGGNVLKDIATLEIEKEFNLQPHHLIAVLDAINQGISARTAEYNKQIITAWNAKQ